MNLAGHLKIIKEPILFLFNPDEQISESNAPLLDQYRNDFLDELINSIKSYFPESDTKEFDVFLPSRIPNEESKIISYGVIQITKICKFFHWDKSDNGCHQLLNDWTSLLRTIIDSPNFCNLRNINTNAMAFWSQMLKTNGIAWTDRIKKLVQTVLVLPNGSAEAERGFSILKIIQDSKRTHSLTLDHVNDIMRVKINAPDEIKNFSASKYAKEWLKQKHKRTDDPIAKRPRKTKLINEYEEISGKQFLPKSTIF